MQHDVNQHSVQTGGTFYKYDAAIILTSLLGRGRISPVPKTHVRPVLDLCNIHVISVKDLGT